MDIKGNKCAIGALMPDDLCELSDNYAAEMVGTGIRGVATRIIQIREFFDGVDINLLSAMQEIHDNHYGTQASNRLKEIAKKWNLTIPT